MSSTSSGKRECTWDRAIYSRTVQLDEFILLDTTPDHNVFIQDRERIKTQKMLKILAILGDQFRIKGI